MLEPDARHLFTDGLRPPAGFTLDVAVGTTYTLDLATLLLPPLAIAAHDRERAGDSDQPPGQPERVDIALLEAVRRFMGQITVFGHAGAIHVPSRYRSILTFAERSLVEVLPPQPGRTFHPKVWALRFTDGQAYVHRLLVLSRNLTRDASWDTIAQLDEDPAGKIDGGPAADLLRELPHIAVRPGALSDARRSDIADLAQTLGIARFAAPPPYTKGELRLVGFDHRDAWPVHSRGVKNLLVLSPFLDEATTRRPTSEGRHIVVSRPEAFAEVGAEALAGIETRTLDPTVEPPAPDDAQTSLWETGAGLHAKVLAWDLSTRSYLYLGSSNATAAGFRGNVEFNVYMSAPRSRIEVEDLFPSDPPERPVSLPQITQVVEIGAEEPPDAGLRAAEIEVHRYLGAFAQAQPVLTVTEHPDDGTFGLALSFRHGLPDGVRITDVEVNPVSRPTELRRIGGATRWTDLALADLTAFLQVTVTVAVDGGEPVRKQSVVTAELVGAPADREARVLRDLVRTEDDVLRYLTYLLDETGSDGLDLERFEGAGSAVDDDTPPVRLDDLALLETLVRAAARGDASLAHVHRFLADLAADHAGPDASLISQDFRQVWDAVWSAVSQPDDGGVR